MRIEELRALSDGQVADLLVLMRELSERVQVDADMLRRVVYSHSSHLFAMTDDDGHIVATATMCVYDSPTGRKSHVEDVVVLSSHRGRGLGRQLVQHLIAYAHSELASVDLYLTSKPSRVAANGLYRALGFSPKETNLYKMEIKTSYSSQRRIK